MSRSASVSGRVTVTENPLAPFLERFGFVVLDGGLATALEREGHDLRDELWSARLLIDDPSAIESVHGAYLRAGADCITTSAYQATLAGLEGRGLLRADAVAALRRSTELALAAVRAERPRGQRDEAPPDPGATDALGPLVAASVGPYGAWLADGSEYHGRYGRSVAELADFHRERFSILAESGADLLACETIPSAEETKALLRLLEETPDCWAWFSFTCADDRVIRDGTAIEDVVDACATQERVAAVGLNCTEPQWAGRLVERIRARTDLPIIVYPNSGEVYDGVTKCWSAGTGGTSWMEGLHAAWAAGARVLGGCCRIGPDEIRELRSSVTGGDFPA